MRRLGFSASLIAGALTLFAACSYSPKIDSGDLFCSDKGECPRGFWCSATNKCCANGDVTCTGSGTGSGGASGTGGATGRTAADFIGTWTFASTASVLTECEVGTPVTGSLSSSTLTITAGATGGTSLTANWSVWQAEQCPFAISLSYDATGGHLVDTSWFCDDTTDNPANAWLVNSFDVVPTSATSATHNALYYRQDTYADGDVVVCQQTVTAQMTRAKD